MTGSLTPLGAAWVWDDPDTGNVKFADSNDVGAERCAVSKMSPEAITTGSCPGKQPINEPWAKRATVLVVVYVTAAAWIWSSVVVRLALVDRVSTAPVDAELNTLKMDCVSVSENGTELVDNMAAATPDANATACVCTLGVSSWGTLTMLATNNMLCVADDVVTAPVLVDELTSNTREDITCVRSSLR